VARAVQTFRRAPACQVKLSFLLKDIPIKAFYYCFSREPAVSICLLFVDFKDSTFDQ
jgi:hypothetical protein